MARDYAERARWALGEAQNALAAGNSAICVRRTQEAMEMAAKQTERGRFRKTTHGPGQEVDRRVAADLAERDVPHNWGQRFWCG